MLRLANQHGGCETARSASLSQPWCTVPASVWPAGVCGSRGCFHFGSSRHFGLGTGFRFASNISTAFCFLLDASHSQFPIPLQYAAILAFLTFACVSIKENIVNGALVFFAIYKLYKERLERWRLAAELSYIHLSPESDIKLEATTMTP